jgi:hypothetical protein
MYINNRTAPEDSQTLLISYCVLCWDFVRNPPASCSSLQSVKHECMLIEGLPGKDTGLLNYNVAWLRGCLSVTKEKALPLPLHVRILFCPCSPPPRALFCHSYRPGECTGMTAGRWTGTCRYMALILYIEQVSGGIPILQSLLSLLYSEC